MARIGGEGADAVVERARGAGATALRAVEDKFYGERSGMIADPFGHRWHVATFNEDVSPEKMQKRWDAGIGA
jgi:PhnB protein